MAKSYEELRFTDDFIFGKVMEDKKLCRDVLECLLQEPVGTLQDVQTEQKLQYTVDGKPIRLDLYTKDETAIYDAEMQNLNHKKIEDLELPKRIRFYQSMVDVDFLQKGNSYRLLPEGKILFICTFDPFGLGLPQYTFENRCMQRPELPLCDGTHKFFYNCTAVSDTLPESLQRLYEFISTGNATSPLTKRIEAAVTKAKHNEQWRSEYMKEWVVLDDARTEGFQAGVEQERENGTRAVILDMLENGADKETILKKLQKFFSLSEEEAEKYWKAAEQ